MIDVDGKWLNSVLLDLVLLFFGACCFVVSFCSVLGYACVVPLVTGCFLMCFAVFDFFRTACKVSVKEL